MDHVVADPTSASRASSRSPTRFRFRLTARARSDPDALLCFPCKAEARARRPMTLALRRMRVRRQTESPLADAPISSEATAAAGAPTPSRTARQTDGSFRATSFVVNARPTDGAVSHVEQCVGSRLSYGRSLTGSSSLPTARIARRADPFPGLCARVAFAFSPRSVRDLCPPRRTAQRAVQVVAPDCGDSSSACFLARAASSTAYSASSIAAYA